MVKRIRQPPQHDRAAGRVCRHSNRLGIIALQSEKEMALRANRTRYAETVASKQREKPRVCMISGRKYLNNAFRCAFYEGQDVLMDVEDIDMIYLEPKHTYNLRYPLQKHLIWRDFTGKAVNTNMVFESVKLTREYDLFIAHLPLMQDLIQLSGVKGWKDRCKRSVCWIDELYSSNVKYYEHWLPALESFDEVVIGLSGTVNALSEALNRRCHYVPGAVDTVRYSPYPDNPERVIDIYSIGRIWDSVHKEFLECAARRKMFYVHDTFIASDVQVKDYRQHRQMHANMAKRSRYYFVAPAKMDAPEDTGGQMEIGFRYYEATAAGSVLVGQVPDCDAFQETFDWPDAVIPLQNDGTDVVEVLFNLDGNPDRLEEISRRNAVEALLRHDWIYRWKDIYRIVGLEATERMMLREKKLREIAEKVSDNRIGHEH
jgi:hypothetical protein